MEKWIQTNPMEKSNQQSNRWNKSNQQSNQKKEPTIKPNERVPSVEGEQNQDGGLTWRLEEQNENNKKSYKNEQRTWLMTISNKNSNRGGSRS